MTIKERHNSNDLTSLTVFCDTYKYTCNQYPHWMLETHLFYWLPSRIFVCITSSSICPFPGSVRNLVRDLWDSTYPSVNL